MYAFKKQRVGAFDVHTAHPEVGSLHYKKFTSGVTPQSQATLNVYVQGTFLLRGGLFEQTMVAGQTSLDVGLSEYEPDQIYVEKVLTGPAKRLCIAKTTGGVWNRQNLLVKPGWVSNHSGVLLYFDGSVLEVTPGIEPITQGQAVFCW